MSYSRRRQSADKSEAAFKAGLALLILFALGIGGLGGFATALLTLVVFGLLCLVLGFAFFLVFRSRLILAKKVGLAFLFSAICTGTIWSLASAAVAWPEVKATVVKITSPPVVVTATYRFQIGRELFLNYTTNKEWATLAEAQKRTPTSLTVYYNPNNAENVTEKATAGWIKVPATLTGAEPRKKGTYQGQIKLLASALNPQMLSVQGDFLAGLKPGSAISVWKNPLGKEEYSLQPRVTEGGKNYPLLAFAGVLGLAGVTLILLKPKEWLAPRPPLVNGAIPPVLPVADTKDALRRIDWYQFEKVSARLLEIDGWEVSRRGGANPDGGADLIARKVGRSAVVQCKYWKAWNIAPKVMRELLGTKVSTGFTADTAILITLSPCSEEALKFAAENGITVYGQDEIVAKIDAVGIESFPEITDPDRKRCPKCDAPMVFHRSIRGSFWGCSTYGTHRCQGKIDA